MFGRQSDGCCQRSAPSAPIPPEPELVTAPTGKLSEDQLTIRKNLKKFTYFVRKVKEMVRWIKVSVKFFIA